MKARLKGTDFTVDVKPYYSDGWFVGYQDMAAPPGVLLYKPEELDFGSEPDWEAYRKETAKAILAGMVSNKVCRAHPDDDIEEELKAQKHAAKRAAYTAIIYADELVRQLKEEAKYE